MTHAPSASTEAPHEKHNRIGREIADKIFAEYPNGQMDAELVVLESLLFAFICNASKEVPVQLKLLRILVEGVIDRLKKNGE